MNYETEVILVMSQHITMLSRLHAKSDKLLRQHGKHTKHILQWPSPFVLTEERQVAITTQQITQTAPDHIIDILRQVQSQLQYLLLYIPQLRY